MIKRALILVVSILTSIVSIGHAQDVAIKTNLLYGGYALTPNLGVEIKMGQRLSFDLSGGYNWFNLEGSSENNKKAVHWLVQPELRWWLCESFNGHFFGLHLLGSQYNIAQHKLPLIFGNDSDRYRYEGWAAGAGISYGYQLPIAKHFSAEFSLGIGYAYMQYNKYKCPKCGTKEESGTVKHYYGPTKAAISLVFNIN